MVKKPDVSVIIPTYNEKNNSMRLLETLLYELTKTKRTLELLVIDDNSPDGTGKTVQKKFKKDPRIRCYIRPKDRGLGKSILLGVLKSQGDIIVGMDADFSHDPKILGTLIASLSGADMVVASRFIAGGGMEDRGRYWVSRMFNWWLRVFYGFPIFDNTSGYYAIRRTTLMKLNPQSIYQGYGDYHLRLVHAVQARHLKIIEIPVRYKKRASGQSKSKLLTMAASYLHTAQRLRSKTP